MRRILRLGCLDYMGPLYAHQLYCQTGSVVFSGDVVLELETDLPIVSFLSSYSGMVVDVHVSQNQLLLPETPLFEIEDSISVSSVSEQTFRRLRLTTRDDYERILGVDFSTDLNRYRQMQDRHKQANCAVMLTELGHPLLARELLKSTTDSHPDNLIAQINFAENLLLFEPMEVAPGQNLFDELIRRYPAAYEPVYAYGNTAMVNDDHERALQLLQRAAELNPKHLTIHLEIASIATTLGRSDVASEHKEIHRDRQRERRVWLPASQ